MIEAFLNEVWMLTQAMQWHILWIESGKAAKYGEVDLKLEDMARQAREITVLCESYLRDRKKAYDGQQQEHE